jgi:hypothetical protein
MSVLSDMLSMLHVLVLGGFVLVTTLLAGLTAVNRLRIRHIRLSWRTGHFFALPLWPLLFIGVVLTFLFVAVYSSGEVPFALFAGYVGGGVLWFASAVMSSAVIVADCGVIANINRARQCVAWGQIIDYFECMQEDELRYAFFYADSSGIRRRLELRVPASCRAQFRAIVREKLSDRFEFAVDRDYGKKALEG